LQTRIPTLSLFSGAGGLDLGFIAAGYDIRGCVEIEPSYVATLRANALSGAHYDAATRFLCQDIREFDCTPFLNQGIECVIGGPPCQTFSAAGRRAGGVIGVDDERGQLFQSYCKILKRLQPKAFVFENVYGLPGANGGAPWRQMIKAFAAVGYELRAEVVDTADYGVPQHRERLIMVGFKVGDFAFPMPTHGPDSDSGLPLVSIEKAIHDLQNDAEPYHGGLGGLYGHLLPEVPEGLNYAFFTAEMGHPEPTFAWRSKFHDLLYKAKRDEPCRTIKAQPGKFTGPFHWKNRHFTSAELKRLQTFPDSYEIVGSYGKIVEQIGNSVPPRLAHAIAASVRDQLLKPGGVLEYPIRPAGFASTFRQRQRERSRSFQEIADRANAERKVVRSSRRAKTGIIEEYFLNPSTLFDRRKHALNSKTDLSNPRYDVKIIQDLEHFEIQFSKNGSKCSEVSTICITGLRKYLNDYDTCTMLAEVDGISDVFHAWSTIEETLISRARFFSLIDIYGHYANKGDAVSVTSDWRFNRSSNLVKLLNRFGSTKDCGDFISSEFIARSLNMTEDQLLDCVRAMRRTRFDIRTSDTHPIIEPGWLLCTYPFPLLSPRALVESRARIARVTHGEEPTLAVAGR
jgi:DNA (cytosine-5)-methyltransferase 1